MILVSYKFNWKNIACSQKGKKLVDRFFHIFKKFSFFFYVKYWRKTTVLWGDEWAADSSIRNLLLAASEMMLQTGCQDCRASETEVQNKIKDRVMTMTNQKSLYRVLSFELGLLTIISVLESLPRDEFDRNLHQRA